jgi:hypothetical protein
MNRDRACHLFGLCPGFVAAPPEVATADGSGPPGLIQALDGNFYGTAGAAPHPFGAAASL